MYNTMVEIKIITLKEIKQCFQQKYLKVLKRKGNTLKETNLNGL